MEKCSFTKCTSTGTIRRLLIPCEQCTVPSQLSDTTARRHALSSADAAPLSAIRRYASASATFDTKLAASLQALIDAAAQFQPLKQASSLGVEDVLISHMIERLALAIPVFVLETGALHGETLQLLARIQKRAAVPIQVYRPDAEAVDAFVHSNGSQAMYQSMELRKACCGIRKMEPLARALAGQRAWVTGLRQEQSGSRAEVPLIDRSEEAQGGRIKVNPLALWTWGDVWHYIALHSLDYNPLHDAFVPSIGCEPCTRAISDGEDFRAGRWWWESESAKECGLHVKEGTA